MQSWLQKGSLGQCLTFGKHSLGFAKKNHHSTMDKPQWKVFCDGSISTF